MENEWIYVFIDELEDEVTLKGCTHRDDFVNPRIHLHSSCKHISTLVVNHLK